MPYEFRLPDVGEGTDSGEIVTWHVRVGDAVDENQPLVDVETDKAVVTITCPTSGVVLELGAEEGEALKVHEVLAVFDTAAEGAPATGASPPRPEAAAAPEPAPTPLVAAAAAAARRPLASPAIRRLARSAGIDLSGVTGSGPGGRIRREDIEAAGERSGGVRGADGRPAAPPPVGAPRSDVVEPLSGVRKRIARTLTHSWQTIPHIIDYREADATGLLDVRASLRRDAERAGGVPLAESLTLVPLLAKIVATLLPRHPRLNASVDMKREEVTLRGPINLGVATATPDGLLVPVVHDADRKSLAEIALEVAELAEAARGRKLTPAQLSGATFTLNNYGALGVWLGTPIIGPGQVANLGVGRVEERPVARAGEVAIRPVVAFACSADHRLLDGDTLAQFVSDLVSLVEEPTLLLRDLR